jgi:hypothetical protein
MAENRDFQHQGMGGGKISARDQTPFRGPRFASESRRPQQSTRLFNAGNRPSRIGFPDERKRFGRGVRPIVLG